jgi:opacity protein-like surface antigen
MRRFLLAAVSAAAFVCAPAMADPTDIIRVPTGEVRERGAVLFGVQVEGDNADRNPEDEVGVALRSSFGVWDGLEAGLDVLDLSDDPRVRGDIAYQFLPRRGAEGLAAKFGVDQIGDAEETRAYVAATYLTGRASLTGGLGYRDDQYGALFGAELRLNPTWGAFAEYSSVNDDEARIGGRFTWREGLVASAYYAREASGAADIVGIELNLLGRLDLFGRPS